MTTRSLPIALLAVALAVAGCGSTTTTPVNGNNNASKLVNPEATPFVNAIEVDPGSGDFLLTTNKGFWRIDPKTKKLTQIKGKISADGKTDTVGTFLEIVHVGGTHLIGSGHPDHQNTLPQFLGFIESQDLGKTWTVVSRLGDADLHKIILKHDKMYAFDAVLGAMLISVDEGKTFTERFTPRGLIIDFDVDPDDEKLIVAATADQLYRSEDEGERWRAITGGSGIRLAWPAADKLYRADQDGTVQVSADRGDSFQPVGKVPGEPYKFKTTDDPDHLYLALGNGGIQETLDGGKTWKVVFTP